MSHGVTGHSGVCCRDLPQRRRNFPTSPPIWLRRVVHLDVVLPVDSTPGDRKRLNLVFERPARLVMVNSRE